MTHSARTEPRIGGDPPRPFMDSLLRGLGRLVLQAYYRQIEVTGSNHLPESGPVIVVANHFNSLVDGVFITSFLPRMPRFLAASTIWDFTPIRPLLNAAGVVPLFRAQDGRKVKGSMPATFTKAAELLRSGGVLAVFPEGKSHNEPSLLPLKSGTARIALEADSDTDLLSVQIVPVALTFEAKNRFRSRTLVEIGSPIAARRDQIEAYRSQDPAVRAAAVKQLTSQISECLQALAPRHETWEEARLIGRAAEIIGQPDPIDAQHNDWATLNTTRRDLSRGYAIVRETHPEQTAALRQDLAEYDNLLRATALRDGQVANTPSAGAGPFIFKTLVRFLLGLPIVCIGLLLNWPPYRTLLALSHWRDLDKRSTWSIFAGFFLFPIFWTIAAIVSGYVGSTIWGAAAFWIIAGTVLIAGPVSGKAMLGYLDLYSETVAEARARTRLHGANSLGDSLTEKRQIILEKLRALVEAHRSDEAHRKPD
ncbi:lysophospholipid acyltransferase family protein [Tateyamaria sp.]|uniref:lysophospholipid acyltransferase family protein n=1 Tax=Tateyamaria sp. TaxID=1929288 RepID=UPI00329D2348